MIPLDFRRIRAVLMNKRSLYLKNKRIKIEHHCKSVTSEAEIEFSDESFMHLLLQDIRVLRSERIHWENTLSAVLWTVQQKSLINFFVLLVSANIGRLNAFSFFRHFRLEDHILSDVKSSRILSKITIIICSWESYKVLLLRQNVCVQSACRVDSLSKKQMTRESENQRLVLFRVSRMESVFLRREQSIIFESFETMKRTYFSSFTDSHQLYFSASFVFLLCRPYSLARLPWNILTNTTWNDEWT